MRLTRQLRDMIFSIAIGPVMIVGIILSVVYANEIEEFCNEVAKSIGRWLWI